MKLALLQHACGPRAAANVKKALALAETAARRGAKVICTQELFRSQYFCQSEDYVNFTLAEPLDGPTVRAFARLAKKRRVVIVVSIFEKRAEGLYHNTAVVLDADGSVAGTYRKMHIPDDPKFYEKFYFAPGDTGFRTFDTRHGRIGVLICWDQWFPEAARLVALQGAQVIFYPTAIGWHPEEPRTLQLKQAAAWETIQRSHAVANGCFVAAVNRVGHERPAGGEGIRFWGGSFVAGTSGEILARAAADQEEILYADIDLGQIDDTRTHWPFLRDRRIDAYEGLYRRWAGDGGR
jgi:N-carbamoylputrescine amidase